MPELREVSQNCAEREDEDEEPYEPLKAPLKISNSNSFCDKMKILEVRAVPAAEAKEVLLAREKEKELGYEQKLAAEHLKKFARLKAEDSKKLVSELDSVVKMSPDTLAQVVNLLPKTAEELRLIFAKEKFNPSEEEIKKILDAVKKVA